MAEDGFTQGDLMATWAFIMTIQPFLIGLHNILGDENFAKFFVDDGNMCANFDKMVLGIEYILEVGPDYGYILNRNKGAFIFWGSVEWSWLWRGRIFWLIDFSSRNCSSIFIQMT